jgi:hypothetical protein
VTYADARSGLQEPAGVLVVGGVVSNTAGTSPNRLTEAGRLVFAAKIRWGSAVAVLLLLGLLAPSAPAADGGTLIYDDGELALWGRNPAGVMEPPVDTYLSGVP